jgi:hypothetical protein
LETLSVKSISLRKKALPGHITIQAKLHWIMENKYCAAGMSHIIDDFLFVGPPNSDKCLVDLQCFSSLCSRLGVPLKPEKTILPTTTIVIYGIEFDSNKYLIL